MDDLKIRLQRNSRISNTSLFLALLVSRFPGKIILCYPFLHSKCLRLCESLKLCGKPRTNRTTPMAPSFSPTKKPNFSLTGSPPAPLTPDRRGDSR
ncbi:endotoxic shock protective protein U9-ORF-like isoform X2 [Peromyscus eremicus]|uniref:endotoxic shock protective protein U9-ORF-like isoform X2 n=1 Tax=Peromyscus eremicus TaxID=42410 RepID=UPI0027DCB04B|nr:endotoxic shock protective protein U9-ORF-like isoform X2 [Peromyscus eremicus]